MTICELKRAYPGHKDPEVDDLRGKKPLMRLSRVWGFLTGESEIAEEKWSRFLEWPPDVFALCAAVLKRSGAYASLRSDRFGSAQLMSAKGRTPAKDCGGYQIMAAKELKKIAG